MTSMDAVQINRSITNYAHIHIYAHAWYNSATFEWWKVKTMLAFIPPERYRSKRSTFQIECALMRNITQATSENIPSFIIQTLFTVLLLNTTLLYLRLEWYIYIYIYIAFNSCQDVSFKTKKCEPSGDAKSLGTKVTEHLQTIEMFNAKHV